MDFLLAFFVAAGVALLLWCLLGLLLSPVFGNDMVTLYLSEGDDDALEQKVRAYGWLRDGRVSGGRFVIVDCGLSEDALRLAQHLRQTNCWVDYCPRQALSDYLEMTLR